MKPRTKIQFCVENLRLNLPCLSQNQINNACSKFFIKFCYKTKSSAFCLECGTNVPLETIKNYRTTCLCCKNRLKVIESNKRTFVSRKYYLSFAMVIESFQLIRTFEFRKFYKKGQISTLEVSEICQDWFDANGNHVVVSKLHCAFADAFQGKLEIRKPTLYKTYNVTPDIYCKSSKFREDYKKLGISSKIINISFQDLLKDLKSCPHVETLLKAEQFDLIYNWDIRDILKYWSSLKICLRNRYKIKEPSIYKDYLDVLNYFKKDLRNSVFVCPKNLREVHNVMMNKKHVEDITYDSERKYIEQKKRFFDLSMKKNSIKIEPLKSVPEFLAEGLALKHCVYKNSYYEKTDSLILSARVKNMPIETIEVSLNDYTVKQCYGYDNKHSQYHDEILNLLNKNISLIQDLSQN